MKHEMKFLFLFIAVIFMEQIKLDSDDRDTFDTEALKEILDSPASFQLFTGIESIEDAIKKSLTNQNSLIYDNQNKRTNIMKNTDDNSTFEKLVDQPKNDTEAVSTMNVNELQLYDKNMTVKLDNVTFSQTVCEGSKQWIQCDLHELIHVVDVFWGRHENQMCMPLKNRTSLDHVDFSKNENVCTSNNTNVTNRVKNLCQNEIQCQLLVNENFLDKLNCFNLPKYLQLKYQCLHSESHIKTDILYSL